MWKKSKVRKINKYLFLLKFLQIIKFFLKNYLKQGIKFLREVGIMKDVVVNITKVVSHIN